MVYDKFYVIPNVVEPCKQLRKAESPVEAGKRAQIVGDALDVAQEPGELTKKRKP